MIRRLYELVTGQPWTTGRQLSADVEILARYGLPPAVRWARELARYSDAELIARGDAIVRRLAARDAAARDARTPQEVRQ